MEICNIPHDSRPENVTLEQFCELTYAIEKYKVLKLVFYQALSIFCSKEISSFCSFKEETSDKFSFLPIISL